MSKLFVSSDFHLFHANIIKYCSRPFSSTEEMNRELVERHNSKVSSEDITINCGDFALTNDINRAAEILNSLNGKFIFLRGNHEKTLLEIDRKGLCKDKIIEIRDLYEINYQGINIVFCHYPLAVWNKKHRGSLHYFGHTHITYTPPIGDKSRDVGVDGNNYYPYSIDELIMLD
jgi:calcineurin-like phosphoesterase family protein